MKHRVLVFSLILIIFTSCLSVFALAEIETDDTQRIVVASVSYSNVKTKQEVKDLGRDILDDYSEVFKLVKEYNLEFKDFKNDLNEFLEESEDDYEERREEKLDEIEVLNKRIKTNTKKYNNAVKESNDKNIDYYQSLINSDNNQIEEITQLMEDDYDVFITVKNEVINQLKAAKKINRSIRKNRDSSKKVKNRFSRFSNAFLDGKPGKKKNNLKKVVNTATTLNQKLFMLETKCRKQLQYFDQYHDDSDAE